MEGVVILIPTGVQQLEHKQDEIAVYVTPVTLLSSLFGKLVSWLGALPHYSSIFDIHELVNWLNFIQYIKGFATKNGIIVGNGLEIYRLAITEVWGHFNTSPTISFDTSIFTCNTLSLESEVSFLWLGHNKHHFFIPNLLVIWSLFCVDFVPHFYSSKECSI